MTKYKAVLFDLDGTLADTSLGIINCHRYTLSQMGRPSPSDELLLKVIGAPLMETYKNRFGFSPDEAKKAVEIYRERYADKGVCEAFLYEGMASLLRQLLRNDYRLGVATLKKEEFAVQLLEFLGVADCFDVIKGMDRLDHLTKKDNIIRCMKEMKLSESQVVLVGDSPYDAIGAKEAGVSFIGVTYGFGFKTKADIYDECAVFAADNSEELAYYLCSE